MSRKLKQKPTLGVLLTLKALRCTTSQRGNRRHIRGRNLRLRTSRTQNKAGGRAAVNATELAEIKVSLGGSVSVYGQPKKIVKSVAVGGTIEQMNPTTEAQKNE
jgi:hypothetical protein